MLPPVSGNSTGGGSVGVGVRRGIGVAVFAGGAEVGCGGEVGLGVGEDVGVTKTQVGCMVRPASRVAVWPSGLVMVRS